MYLKLPLNYTENAEKCLKKYGQKNKIMPYMKGFNKIVDVNKHDFSALVYIRWEIFVLRVKSFQSFFLT